MGVYVSMSVGEIPEVSELSRAQRLTDDDVEILEVGVATATAATSLSRTIIFRRLSIAIECVAQVRGALLVSK